jgi:hypothetical protein
MTKGVDKHQVLEGEIFGYRASKDGKVFITWHGKAVKTLKDGAAKSFLKKIGSAGNLQAQLIMAKLTGNFKRGNERPTPNPSLEEGE